MKVIYVEIERKEKIRVELGTEFIFIEADQAMCTKFLDAMFKMRNDGKDVFERIIPRMGSFHITIYIRNCWEVEEVWWNTVQWIP